VFWRNAGNGRYEQVKVMESPAIDLTEGRFLPPKTLRAKVLVLGEGRSFSEGQEFVDVPQTGCNTWCTVDNVFAIRGGDFIPVQIESPEAWYKSRLRPGESTWNSNRNSFSDNNLSFAFSIWAREDPHASPSAGVVTGTYKIIRENKPALSGAAVILGFGSPLEHAPNAPVHSCFGHPQEGWKMVVDTAERKPPAGH
jgi:hypothetical protein